MLKYVVGFSPWKVLTSTCRGLKETVKAQVAWVSLTWGMSVAGREVAVVPTCRRGSEATNKDGKHMAAVINQRLMQWDHEAGRGSEKAPFSPTQNFIFNVLFQSLT